MSREAIAAPADRNWPPRISEAEVSGRPKHIYSIWQKMRGKELDFSELYDVRAFRVIVTTSRIATPCSVSSTTCGSRCRREFDDYISRPKAERLPVAAYGRGRRRRARVRSPDPHAGNARLRRIRRGRALALQGSRHARRTAAQVDGQRQIRREDRVVASTAGVERRSLRRRARREAGAQPWEQLRQATLDDDHIYVLTPQARVIATAARRDRGGLRLSPAQRAWASMPWRACRRRDGAAQHAAAERSDRRDRRGEGGRSVARLAQSAARLSAEPAGAAKGARVVQRGRSPQENIASGRAMVEKTLQREGKTSVNLDQLAAKLGFKTAEDLFAVVGKEEFSLRNIEQALHDAPPPEPELEAPEQFEKRSSGAKRRARCVYGRAGGRRGRVAHAARALLPSGSAGSTSAASSRAARACRSTAAIARPSCAWPSARRSVCLRPRGPQT